MDGLKRLARLANALSDPGRVKVLLALKGRSLCICHVVEILKLSFPTVSRHVSILEDAGLLVTERRGKWTYCSLPGRKGDKAALAALRWLHSSAALLEVGAIEVPTPKLATQKRAEACCGKGRRRGGAHE